MQEIRLNKRTKAIKVVNRKDVIKLQHSGKTGPAGVDGKDGDIPLFVGPEQPPVDGYLWVDTDEESPEVTTAQIIESPEHRFTNDTDIQRLKDTSGVNTGDQDLSTFADKAQVEAALATKVGIEHDHTTADITDLSTVLNAKADQDHTHTKADVGLGNVDNTSDADKPVSTAQSEAIEAKASKLSIPQFTVPVRSIAGNGEVDASRPWTPAATAGTFAYRGTGGVISVGTPTANDHATTKSYVDTADATKVSKSGDTMTGNLTVQTAAGSTSLFLHNTSTSGRQYEFYSNSSGQFGIYDKTRSIGVLKINSDASFEALTLINGGVNIGGCNYITGTGFPNGTVSAPVGSIYIDKNVTNGASSWIKKSGTGNTGWQVLEGDTGWRNITASISNHLDKVQGIDDGVWIRRINNMVHVHVKAQVMATGEALYTINTYTGMNMAAALLVAQVLRNSSKQIQLYLNGSSIMFLANPTAVVGDRVQGDSITTCQSLDNWPTTLPGTAA